MDWRETLWNLFMLGYAQYASDITKGNIENNGERSEQFIVHLSRIAFVVLFARTLFVQMLRLFPCHSISN